MTLKRTEFKRKPPAEKKVKPKKCKASKCSGTYLPDARQPWKCWCSDDCAVSIALAKVEKQEAAKARKERAEVKEKLEKFKRKGDYLNEAQSAFNAYIRYRDRDQPCICCGSFDAGGAGGVGGGWDAGHWLSRGHAPHLRFHENNVHRQRKGCNRPGGTTRAKFRLGLVARIGEMAVAELERLEYEPTGAGWSIEDLKQIATIYRAKLRELKRAAA